MRQMPNYRLGVQLSGPEKISYRHSEMIQKKLYSDIFRGTAIGEKVHKDKYSLFTYSILADKPRFDADGYASTNGQWIFRFASAYRDLLSLLESELQARPEIDLLGEGTLFEIKGIYREPLLNRNIFQAQPILAISPEKEILIPQDDKYFEALNVTLLRKWEFFFGKSGNRLKSIKFTRPPRQKRIQYKNRNLTCFAGSVKMQGKEETLKFAQCVGLGHLTSCGLGMLI